MKQSGAVKKIVKITANTLLYTFIALCVFVVVLTITGKRSGDDGVTLFGMQMRVVISPSMEKSDETDVSAYDIEDIPLNSMVFIDVVPHDEAAAQEWYADLKVGDVLTFKYVYVKQETITHRIVRIVENENGGYTIDLEGDNKSANSEVLAQTIDTSQRNSPNYVIGKVVGQNYLLGIIVSALKSKLGLVIAIILPSVIIVIFEVVKIVKMFESDKRQKAQDKIDDQQSELDELRRRLAELERQQQDALKVTEDPTAATGEDPPNYDANGNAP